MQALNGVCGLYCLFLVTFSQAKTVKSKFNATVDNGECQSSAPSLVQKSGSHRNVLVKTHQEPEGRKVTIMCGNGRLGNNLHSLVHGMHFAQQIHATQVKVGREMGQLSTILDMPVSLTFNIPQTDETRWSPIPSECNDVAQFTKNGENSWISSYWDQYCEGSANSYRTTAFEMVRPLFKPELSACAEGSTEGENPDETLTVHLRGDDMWGVPESQDVSVTPDNFHDLDMNASPNHWLWNHPPCSMYKKIITEEGFKHVVLITSPDLRHPCVKWPWFQDRVNEGAITFRVQSGTLLDDTCHLLRAHNLVLSFSTFPEAMALQSTHVKRIFSRVHFQEHTVMDGNGWEGTTVHRYDVPIDENNHFDRYPNTMAGLIDWYRNYPDDEIKLYTQEVEQ